LVYKTEAGKTSTVVGISPELWAEAQKHSRLDQRSVTGQIECWARLGKCAEENPELSLTLIKDILLGAAELDRGEKTEYRLDR
jgi:hypothetical protein